jgi:beta-glucosidase-like glycosyl hydrolase
MVQFAVILRLPGGRGSTLHCLPIGCEKHMALARKVADESMVLLKNEPVDGQPLLPIVARKVRKIVMVGPRHRRPARAGFAG